MPDQDEDNRVAGLLTEDEIRRRMNEALERAAAAQREAEGWRLILRGRRAIVGHESGEPEVAASTHPGNTAAILRIMGKEPMRVWAVRELYNALEDRGWLPKAADPRKSLGATLSSMTSRGILDRIGRATYRLASAQATLTNGGDES